MKKLVSICLILSVFILTAFEVPEKAVKEPSKQGKFIEQLESFGENYAELSQKKSEKVFKKIRKEIEKDELVVHGDLNEIKTYNVFESKVNKSKVVNIVFDTNSKTYHTYSVTLEKDSIIDYGEMILTKKDSQTGAIKNYSNGDLIVDKEYDVPAKETASKDETQVSTAAFEGLKDWWSDFSYCMEEKMQVPGWVITGIGVACGVACVGTAGAGCVACVYAASGAYSFDVGYCLAYAGDH